MKGRHFCTICGWEVPKGILNRMNEGFHIINFTCPRRHDMQWYDPYPEIDSPSLWVLPAVLRDE
jgi:hypothetical protein